MVHIKNRIKSTSYKLKKQVNYKTDLNALNKWFKAYKMLQTILDVY